MEAIGGLLLAGKTAVASAVSAVGGTTAAAGGASAAGAAASSALKFGSLVLGGLKLGGNVTKSLSAYQAAKAQATEFRSRAVNEEFKSRDEYIKGKQEQTELYRKLASTVSNQAIAFASGGVSLASLSVQTARDQAKEDAENALQANMRNTEMRRLGRLKDANTLRLAADNTVKQGRTQLKSDAVFGVADLLSGELT